MPVTGCFPGGYSQFKTFADLMVFLTFIVGVCWYTGRITSPFISLLYLVLMATALTQGRRITYLMAGLAITSYILLASRELHEFYSLTHILELFPYMAHRPSGGHAGRRDPKTPAARWNGYP